jgi:undecaprenyl-diphosphatase
VELYKAVILGIIQGLAEFLPISSSGHLVIFQHYFGIQSIDLFFNVSLHMGTLLAVIFIFKKDIFLMIKSMKTLFSSIIYRKANMQELLQNDDLKLAWLIIIGSVPTAIIGLILKKYFLHFLSSPAVAAAMLIVTGTILLISKLFEKNMQANDIESFSLKHALIIGIAQGVSVIPGISRSGATIVTALGLGIDKELSGKFSFLLSIPAIVGAEILCLKELNSAALPFDLPIVVGTFFSFIVGLCVLKILLFIIKKGKFYIFAPYCFIVGFAVLLELAK